MFHIHARPAKQKCERAFCAPASPLRHPARPPLGPVFERAPRRGRGHGHGNNLGGFLRLGKRRPASHIRRRDSNEHEIRISPRPTQSLLLRFKKPVDHKGVPFTHGPAGEPRRFSAANGRAGIHRQQGPIGKRHLASVRNASRIHRAMTDAQPGSGRTNMTPGPAIGSFAAAGPVNGYAGQDGLFESVARRSQEQQEN